MVEQAGALGYFGDARRAAVGTELIERVTATGSLVIRKLGATACRRTGDPSFSLSAVGDLPGDAGNPGRAHAVGHRGPAHCRRAGHHRDQFRRPRGQSARAWRGRRCVSAGFFIHPLLAIDSETEAVLGLLDAQIWTRDEAIEAAPRRQRAIEDRKACAGCAGSSAPVTC